MLSTPLGISRWFSHSSYLLSDPRSLCSRESKGRSQGHMGNKGQLMEFKSVSFKVILFCVWDGPQKNWISGGGGRREVSI